MSSIKPLLPNLRSFTLDTGLGFAKDIIQSLPQGIHRLFIGCARSPAMAWDILEALQDPFQLPALREIPIIIVNSWKTAQRGDPVVTTEHVDAAIAGLKQRKYLVYSEAAAARLYKLVDHFSDPED